jgi:hypothetical protein
METLFEEDKALQTAKSQKGEFILVNIPMDDILFFRFFANKMGWEVSNRQALWDNYIKSSTKEVDLTEDEIMTEVRAVRYGTN